MAADASEGTGDGSVYQAAFERLLAEEMSHRREAQRRRADAAQARPRGGGEEERRRDDSAARRRIVASQWIPREAYGMMRFDFGDYELANWWNFAHCWQSNFGLTGAIAEAEESRTRCLITQSTPATVLFELASIATFNMLDPVIGHDIMAMHDAVNDCLLKRTRDSAHYPLSYVLQGAGPHFCPGGNHHPVNPPGGTPLTMNPYTTSVWNVMFREHAMPGITAISGSAIGGGVAISLSTTQRVVASNASMAFGNISRGASPLMWLSKNLVNEVGMAGAISLYLTDSTCSAYGALKAGLVMAVGNSIQAAKNRAMVLSRSLARSPASRLVCHQLPDLDVKRFAFEAAQFQFNSRNATMFANISGLAAKSKRREPAEPRAEPAKPQWRVSAASR